jgi:hypothetical protein
MTETTDGWTALDQQRADAFAQQVLHVAGSMPGHPDAVVLAFTQATGSLMGHRIIENPTRATAYRRMIDLLRDHVEAAIAATTMSGDVSH